MTHIFCAFRHVCWKGTSIGVQRYGSPPVCLLKPLPALTSSQHRYSATAATEHIVRKAVHTLVSMLTYVRISILCVWDRLAAFKSFHVYRVCLLVLIMEPEFTYISVLKDFFSDDNNTCHYRKITY